MPQAQPEGQVVPSPPSEVDPRPRRVVHAGTTIYFEWGPPSGKYPPGAKVFELPQRKRPRYRPKPMGPDGKMELERLPPDPRLVSLADELGALLGDLVREGKL
jgi:hypothetical protein